MGAPSFQFNCSIMEKSFTTKEKKLVKIWTYIKLVFAAAFLLGLIVHHAVVTEREPVGVP